MMIGREYFLKWALLVALSTNRESVYAFSWGIHFLPTNRLTSLATAYVPNSRSPHVNDNACRRKHGPSLMLSQESSQIPTVDDTNGVPTIHESSKTNDTSTLTEVNLDWKVWYENAVVQIHTMQQQVNDQIQALLNQIEELQQLLKTMTVELQNKNVQILQAQNETLSWQTLYATMRQQHLSEMEAIQNQYDTYVQNQRHEQVRNQIQYQRMQQQLKGQNSDYQSDLQQLQMQHENEMLLLVNDHTLLLQQLQANATLHEQELLDQSKRELSRQLRHQEEQLDRTVVEPLRRELQGTQMELRTARDSLLQSQAHIAELERSQKSVRFLLSKLYGVCWNRIAVLSPRRWLLPKFRRRTVPQSFESNCVPKTMEMTSKKVDLQS